MSQAHCAKLTERLPAFIAQPDVRGCNAVCKSSNPRAQADRWGSLGIVENHTERVTPAGAIDEGGVFARNVTGSPATR